MLDENMRIIVLDDDPTGTQTVNHVNVYTDWSVATLSQALAGPERISYVLTNSRSFSKARTVTVHEEIAQNLLAAAARTGRRFLVVSRSDSVLRGHYPLETETLRRALRIDYDGEIIMPFFPEGRRYTCGDIHYAQIGCELIPVAETEFARDATFGYHASHLGEWVEEKTGGRYTKESCVYIPCGQSAQATLEQLMTVDGFRKVIVNATCYAHARAFAGALEEAMARGKRFLLRTAAALPKVLGGVKDMPLLTGADILTGDRLPGGLIVVGSHVQKTTEQLYALLAGAPLEQALFDSHLALDPGALRKETERVRRIVEKNLCAGRTTVVYTRREALNPPGADGERRLRLSVDIARALSRVVGELTVRPSYLIAKGGITSSDIATSALGIHCARVLGQISPGIPVWKTGSESKFEAMPYVIFPGNVGDRNTLRDIVRQLEEYRNRSEDGKG